MHIKCPACNTDEFVVDELDPDYYHCKQCETLVIAGDGGILTQAQRNFLENQNDD